MPFFIYRIFGRLHQYFRIITLFLYWNIVSCSLINTSKYIWASVPKCMNMNEILVFDGGQHATGCSHYSYGTVKTFSEKVSEGMPDQKTVLDLGTKQYCLGKVIGEGTYSKVCTAILKMNDDQYPSTRQVACKVINKREAGTDFVKRFLPREIRILKSISHPNIISIFDIVELNPYVYVLMGFCKHGDLLDYIRKKGAIAERKTKQLFKQVVSAVRYLHEKEIAHRDLKCENILLCGKNVVKIGDFGFARLCKSEHNGHRILSNTFCGSAAYAAPEIIQGAPYNPKMYDLWSMGVILYIMLTGQMPFDDSNIQRMLKFQQNRVICFSICYNMKITTELKNLLIQLLEPDVTKRATIIKVAKSKWFFGSMKRSHKEKER